MASSYNTRSTATAIAVPSIKIEPIDHTQGSQRIETPTTVGNVQPRHYCIAFTNNPRMLRKASQKLSLVTTTNIPTGQSAQHKQLPPQTRQRTASESRQRSVSPSVPSNQYLQVPSRFGPFHHRSPRRPSQRQVIPPSPQPKPEPDTSAQHQIYEQNIEAEFKAQMQPILQNYLNKTKRSPPVNLFLDMSSMIQF